jgi:hypothetical protein
MEQRAVDAGMHSGDLCHAMVYAPELFKPEFKSEVNPKPETRNPKPETRNPKPERVVYAPELLKPEFKSEVFGGGVGVLRGKLSDSGL